MSSQQHLSFCGCTRIVVEAHVAKVVKCDGDLRAFHFISYRAVYGMVRVLHRQTVIEQPHERARRGGVFALSEQRSDALLWGIVPDLSTDELRLNTDCKLELVGAVCRML